MSRKRRLSPDPFEVTAEAWNPKGSTSASKDGAPLTLWGALPGETVNARYLFGRRFKGQAETLDVIDPSPDRVTAPCASFGTCSACTLQHVDYQAQLDFKQRTMLDWLSSKGGVVPARILPPLAAEPWAYRRKARLSVRDVPRKGRVLVGFRERDGRFVTDMQSCHTLDARVASALPGLSELVGKLEARARIPQIEVTCGDDHVVLVFRHLDDLASTDLEKLRHFEAETELRVYLQPKGPNTVKPLSPGPSRLNYRLEDSELRLAFEPLDFIQVNASVNRLMIAQAMAELTLTGDDRVLDLFCGMGNFTLPLARHSGAVLGLEGSPDLVERARDNARDNGLANVSFAVSDLYSEGVPAAWPEQRFDAVLMDPPRSGAGALLEPLAALRSPKILYVSCNPETLAVDLGVLVREHGYRLTCAGIMDMFPQTAHIETMALLEHPDGA